MAFWGGLLLGFAMILPIGAQNLFVLNSGLLGGWRRGLVAAVTAGVCDTALILVGAAGLSSVLVQVAGVRLVLLALGVGFLAYLGVASLRAKSPAATAPEAAPEVTPAPAGSALAPASVPRILLTGVGVSWGNPHAILDTVTVLGATIAAQSAADRTPFAAGAVAASWLFFLLLALIGGGFGARLPRGAHRWISRVSGAVMLLFAAALLVELIRSVGVGG